MLSDALQQVVREAGGEAILLDARRSRALVTEFSKLITILKNLRNGGFTRLIDFTAMHLGQNRHGLEEYHLFLTLRAPDHGHEGLSLKWKWPDLPARLAAPVAALAADDGPEVPAVDPALAALGVSAHAIGVKEREAAAETKAAADEARLTEPEEIEQLNPADTPPHPTLSRIWQPAGLCEREIWEMLGIPFSGNDNMKPLFLDEQFRDRPLRRDFTPPARENYAVELLAQRTEVALMGTLANPVPDDKKQITEDKPVPTGDDGGGA